MNIPVQQCQVCGYVVVDASAPCPSCGNIYVRPVQPSVQNDPDASDFSFKAVLGRSFSVFFKHPFVFVGLIFLSQILGFVTTLLTRTRPGLINTIFGLAIQGAVIYGVYDALQGKAVRFGRTLSKGLERSWSLFLASIVLGIFFFVLNLIMLFALFGKGALIAIPIFLLTAWLYCQWCMFAPACVVEHLEPMGSLFRSSILTRGCRLKITGLYLLCFVIAICICVVFEFIGGVFTAKTIGRALIRELVLAVPVALTHVTTAVIYYELLRVQEGVTLDKLESVINDAVDYVDY